VAVSARFGSATSQDLRSTFVLHSFVILVKVNWMDIRS
jgi:hypothetical protein